MRTGESRAMATMAGAERAHKVIADTITLIESPARWIRGIAASASGKECKPGDCDATSFCLYATMRRAAGADQRVIGTASLGW